MSFLIYINDLEEGVTSKTLKFADETNLSKKIKRHGDKHQLQDDIVIDKLSLGVDHDKIILQSTPFPTIPMLGKKMLL